LDWNPTVKVSLEIELWGSGVYTRRIGSVKRTWTQ
jgi:hypothetical protein